MKRKIFTLCTALILGASALLASETAVDGIYYDFDDANLTATVTYRGNYYYSYTKEYIGDVAIPTTVTYGGKTYSVTSIGDYAFYECSKLTAVTIPNSVTSIGDYAFYECSGLTSVTIPNSVTSIGDYAFYECSSLTSVTIPNSVTSIGYSAFVGCSSLTSVTIPNSVKSIEYGTFALCSGLTSIIVENGNPKYDSRDNCNAIIETATNTLIAGCQSTTIPNSVESIGAYAFNGCTGLTSVTIGNSVTSIGDWAFSGCTGLTSVTIPNSVTSIGGSAFSGCSGLTSVTIGNSVEIIGGEAFFRCTGLTSVTIPNSVTSIGDYAFYECSGLTSVTIPNSVTSIGEGAFCGCSGLTSVTIPNSVTSIGEYAFSGCSGLTSIIVESGNTKYDSCNNCNAIIETATNTLIAGCQSTTIPNSVTSIGEVAFWGCSGLTSVTIGNSVESIGAYAFNGCSGLTSVTIGNSVTSIGEGAFVGCSELKTVVIGNAVTNIGDGAFYGCDRLLYFTCYAEEPPFVGTDPFSTYNAYLKVPCSGLDAYKMYDVWRNFNNISCIGSDEVQVTEFNVTPSVNDAQFTWPTEPNAATYELVISKDGVVFCTLTFNANGQLMGIAFAPSANAPAAAPTTSGFQFTVTGLDEASHYTYTFDAKDAGGNVIKHYAGEFNTEGSTVGLEQIELANIYTQDGRIVCEGEFRIYDLLGRDVTRLNGSLCGVYVVKSGNSAVKVVVK